VILLVEDNKMNQLVGSKVLAKLGYAFEVANHGAKPSPHTGEALRRRPDGLPDAGNGRLPGQAEIRRIEGRTEDPDHRHDGRGHGRRP